MFNITNLTCRIICILVRVAESTAIYTVQEGVAIYGYLGASVHGAGISATQYAQDGEVWNTLGVVEDWDGSLCGVSAVVRTSHLFGIVIIIHLSIIVAIISFYIHGYISEGYGGVLAISATEYREVREVVVVIRILPFFCIQKVERSHTLQHLYHGSTFYIAGKIAAAIDIMRVQEMFLGAFCIFFGFSEERRTVFTVFGIPFDERIIYCIPYLVPDDIDGEAVLWLSVIAFFLSAHILCQGYVTACNIGRSELLLVGQFFTRFILDVTHTATEYLSGEVGSEDVDMGAASYLRIVAAAIDVAIDGRCLLAAASKGDVGIAKHLSHFFWAFGKAVC